MSVQCNKYLSDKEIQEDLHNSWDQNFIVSDEDVSEVEDNIVEYNDTAPVSESGNDMNDSVADNDNINNTSVIENYVIAANDDTKLDYHDLWSERFGRPVYLATMSRNRFRELVKVIRFDDKDTREDSRKGDKFAPLREVFGLMNETFLQYYCPGESVVIDEMSLFRGRCPFKVFMKEKPGKYGAVIRILADCRERYVLRMEVYAGETEDSTPVSRGPKPIVKRLATPLKESGRNITTDRYYTSVEPAEELYTDYVLH
ncbi:hypothetical protein ANN_11284, partial [Periplaneta americana]